MDKALYTAMTGASALMRAQSAVAHNLANVSTNGFKAELVHTEQFQVPGRGLPTRFDVREAKVGFDASTGPLQNTGNELDVALHEGVWLAVLDDAGQEAYTRAGELRLGANGQLTTASGRPVLGPNGPVSVPPREKLLIGADGGISIVPEGQTPQTLAEVGRLKLVRPDQAQLTRGPDGLFRQPADAPAPLPAVGVSLTSGALEGSNVSAAGSLVHMIELQRQFEAQVKLMKSTEENARLSASLMRLS
ncbi:flagellar basal body rod protein FlgF [Pseudomarimonas salicorniae]|uniref:Flagellar basal-body rod protein FlgF n=1 Tax=Pseudomarimonas salicorniae TaxID=2933270 RepID=A0ABT0GMC2_9GAMM|nr:flagellar basal body rod protein FlgF [Lysobacter sp. CAU 1642]MCK7595167.1 flagellar basal body rod protein FlgF [Lysobacter sp. CAU 1642]